LSKIVVEKTRSLTSTADECIGGIKQIKLFNYYDKIQKEFDDACWEADFSNRKSGLIVEWQSVVSAALGLVALAIVLLFNYQYQILSIAFLGIFLTIVRMLMTTMATFNQKIGFLNQSLPAMDKITEFLKSVDKTREISGDVTTEKFLKNSIEFRHVCLDYGKGNILKDVSLKIYKGQKIALVGESGSGKTSIANLLVRLYNPTSGQILIDDTNIADYTMEQLRNNIGVVNQDNIIFNKSVEENILMSRPGAEHRAVKQAAKNAFAHEFIEEFSDKYSTIVGDRGVKMSGGQRQRVNIAQMFLKQAPLIILDEATSALDSKSERIIQEALDHLESGCTSLVIAHRLATVQNADRVIVLDQGRIAENGTWDELMLKKGIFYQMVKEQSFLSDERE
jgi:subfamily B ATP-binding cassette protein MsbA